MSYSVYRFTSPDRHTRAVPTFWISEDKTECYYPKKSALVAEKMVAELEPPLKNIKLQWEKYHGVELKSGVTLQTARKRAIDDKDNAYEGMLSSDVELGPRKRRKKKKTYPDCITSSPTDPSRLCAAPRSPGAVFDRSEFQSANRSNPSNSKKVGNSSASGTLDVPAHSKTSIMKSGSKSSKDGDGNDGLHHVRTLNFQDKKKAATTSKKANTEQLRDVLTVNHPDKEHIPSTTDELLQTNEPLPPSPKKTAKKKAAEAAATTSSSIESTDEADPANHNQHRTPTKATTSRALGSEFGNALVEVLKTAKKKNKTDEAVPNLPRSLKGSKKGGDMSDSEFKDFVVNALSIIVDSLHITPSKQASESGVSRESPKNVSSKTKYNKICTLEELLDINDKLNDEKFRNSWIESVIRDLKPNINDSMSVPEVARRVMKSVVSQELMLQLNFTGRSLSKFKLQGTNFCRCIFDVFRKLGFKKNTPVKKGVMRVLQKANDHNTQSARLKSKCSAAAKESMKSDGPKTLDDSSSKAKKKRVQMDVSSKKVMENFEFDSDDEEESDDYYDSNEEEEEEYSYEDEESADLSASTDNDE